MSPGILSDHSMVLCTIESVENKRGPGLWKLNEQLLDDEKYCEAIKESFQSIKEGFGHLDSVQFWEILKFELANVSKDFVSEISRNKKS